MVLVRLQSEEHCEVSGLSANEWEVMKKIKDDQKIEADKD